MRSTIRTLPEDFFRRRQRGTRQILEFIIGVNQSFVILQKLVAKTKKGCWEILRLIYQDGIVERLPFAYLFKSTFTDLRKLITATESAFCRPKIEVFDVIGAAKFVVNAVALASPWGTPCVDNSQIVPVGLLSRLFDRKIVDQAAELTFQGACIEGDGDAPLGCWA